MRLGLFLALALLIWGSLIGCSTTLNNAAEAGKIRVGVVYDIGGKDDKSFNAAAFQGALRAKEQLPIVMRDAEPGDPTSIEPCLRAFAERGYDLIIGVGFAQAPIIESVARDYPQLKFAIIDSVIDLPNVASLVFKEHEGSFLVGMIAARSSKTGKIGFVGGMDIPLIHKFQTGYEEGAKYINPQIQVIPNYVGITDAAWNNPGKGKELAKSQYENGADVIFQAAGNSGLGVFDAAEEMKHLAIGVDSNQNWIKPGFILTSMLKRVDNAVHSIIQETVQQKFQGGLHIYGLENEGVGFALDNFNKPLISEQIIQEVQVAKSKILAGEIKVTDAMAK
jgi:basic membrane protein A and related proteins